MNKIILILMFCGIAKVSHSQTYTFGAITTSNMTVKSEGEIILNDSIAIFISEGKKFNYKIIKSTNGNPIYLTDGVLNYSLIIDQQSGKKKGFEYDYMINYQADKNNGGINLIYWCKRKNKSIFYQLSPNFYKAQTACCIGFPIFATR
jgi:hypothetical protein